MKINPENEHVDGLIEPKYCTFFDRSGLQEIVVYNADYYKIYLGVVGMAASLFSKE